MQQNGCESIIHGRDRDFWAIMLVWVDVLDSDRGNFRCRHT